MQRARWSQRVRRTHRTFTLVELVIVVTIIGIIAAIAVPRMSTATARASSHALQATLTNVRKAIDRYYAEHGKYPGHTPGTNTPDGAKFVEQLTMHTTVNGSPNDTYGYPCVYGPYLRKPFPANPTNGLRTVFVKAAPEDADPADGSVGWVAVLSHGYFGISATDTGLDNIGVEDATVKTSVRGIVTN